ncbi:MAG: antibiotic biosynthesis monooxygenase family protein [Anaeromyxobacteraceae bacterium]
MILAVSRFRVANGLAGDVRQAFLTRPRRVENARGFLGLETFVDPRDPATFVLVTRWSDEPSFRAWHASPEHHRSHEGIPRGLKLDATATELRILERIEASAGPAPAELVGDGTLLLAAFLADSVYCHAVVTDRGGTVLWCNAALARAIGAPAPRPVGEPLQRFLAGDGAPRFAALLADDSAAVRQRLSLAVGPPGGTARELSCIAEVRPGALVLVGEPARLDPRVRRPSPASAGPCPSRTSRSRRTWRRSPSSCRGRWPR